MATKVETRSDDLYRQDYYLWAERQAALLSAGRFEELDLEHLVDEVGDLAALAKSSVFNNARVVVEHLLKLEYSPAQEPRRFWRNSVREHRRRVQIDITPRLRQLLEADLERLYQMAEHDVTASLRDYGEDEAADRLPKNCPYTVEQILGDWLP